MGFISRTLVRLAYAVGGARAAGWTQSWVGSGKAGYDANNPTRRILSNRPGNRTAAELSLSELPALRAYARQLERNNPTARAACDATTALVVGSGISLEPDQPEWSEKQAEKVRKEWLEICDHAAVDGRSIYELQAQGWRDVFTAGELVWRLVYDAKRIAKGEIGLCLLPLESEWLDNFSGAIMQVMPDRSVRVGPITLDVLARPISYDLRNPENVGTFAAETVPAQQIIHVFEKRRSMQTRGESWLAPVIETLNQERDLVVTELQSAKSGASIGLAVTSEYHAALDTTTNGTSEDPAQSLRIGGVARLDPGDKLESFQNTRPSQQIMPFRAGLRGDTAAATRVPQRFLDRDISRVGSYSAMRGDNQDEERLIGPCRDWYGHGTIGRFYCEVLPFICAKVGVPLPKRIKYKLLPDGQPYVDPEKDIAASNAAINSDLSTKEAEVGKRGGDWRAIAKQRESERLREALSSVAHIAAIQNACDESGVPGLTWSHILTLGGAATAPGAYLGASVQAPAATVVAGDVEPTEKPEEKSNEELRHQAFVDGLRFAGPQPAGTPVQVINEHKMTMDAASAAAMGAEMGKAFALVPAATITVAAAPAQVAVNVQSAVPDIQVSAAAPIISVAAAAPTIQVAPSTATVQVENVVQMPARTVRATPQRDGSTLIVPQ